MLSYKGAMLALARRAMPGVCAVVVCVSLGCRMSRERVATRDEYLEEFLVLEDTAVTFSGGWYNKVHYRLKEGVEPTHATKEIRAYLEGAPGARCVRLTWWWGGLGDDYKGLHPRDFWAMVLADLEGITMSIPADGKSPHEEEIAAVLAHDAR